MQENGKIYLRKLFRVIIKKIYRDIKYHNALVGENPVNDGIMVTKFEGGTE